MNGCSKKVIVIKDTGSDLFEEAYFVCKTQRSTKVCLTESEFVAEANRIVSENIASSLAFPALKKKPKKRRINRDLKMIFAGAIMSGCVFAIMHFLKLFGV